MKQLDDFLVRLRSQRPAERSLAAAEIADLFDANQLGERPYRKAVNALIPLALAETDPSAREDMFNALSSAASADRTWKIDWGPIAERLEELEPDCLEHALVILGFSGDARHATRIKRFLMHPDQGVRSEAEQALKMLGSAAAKASTQARKA